MSTAEALALFVAQLRADGRADLTIRQYQHHVRLLDRWLAERHPGISVETLDHVMVASFLGSPEARLRANGTAKRTMTMNALRTSLRVFSTYIHQAGYCTINPARLVRRARGQPAPPRSLSADEQARLLAVLREAKGTEAERDYVLFQLMLATGLRIGSALGLEARDVDLDQGEILVRRAKGEQPYTVIVPPSIHEDIQRFLGQRGPGRMFTSATGRPITSRQAQRRLDQWATRAGLGGRVTPHTLRHAFGMRIYRKTGDLPLVQRALGHRSIRSTAIYARCCSDRLREILA